MIAKAWLSLRPPFLTALFAAEVLSRSRDSPTIVFKSGHSSKMRGCVTKSSSDKQVLNYHGTKNARALSTQLAANS